MINHKDKFIFVHIPKAAGTSISETLRPYGLVGDGHLTLQQIQNKSFITDKQLNTFYKFTSVRNPWEFIVSQYFNSKLEKSFWHSKNGSTKYGKNPIYKLTNNVTFKKFVELLVNNKIEQNGPAHPCKKQQSHWLDKRLDFIIRFETLADGFAKVCKKIGYPDLKLKKLNSSKHNHYSTYYDDESRDWVAKYYSEDIEQLGYKFDNI